MEKADLMQQALFSSVIRELESGGYTVVKVEMEKESGEYAAARFFLDNKKILFRVSKITPTKNGQFVTIWKRNEAGVTCPFDISDGFDFVMICCRDEQKSGAFLFPVEVLVQKRIFSSGQRTGKRGIRVYPPWVKPESLQAAKTQAWQTVYFKYQSGFSEMLTFNEGQMKD